MKRNQKIVVCSLVLFLAVVFFSPKTIRVESKSFHYSEDNGVLTVWGDGAMPSWIDLQFNLADRKIKKIIVKEGITSLPKHAFWGLYEAKEVEIADTVTEIGNRAFLNCSNLKEVVIPDSVKKLGKGVFEDCDSLKKAVLPDGLKKIPNATFSGCYSLEDVKFPETVEVIGARAFQYTRVPSSILRQGKIKEIESDAFGHTAWRSLVLPKTIKKVHENAFSILKLERVVICGSTKEIDNRAFNEYGSWNFKRLVLTYKGGAREWQTALWELFLQGKRKNHSLCWQKVSGADGYQIQISRDLSFRTTKTYDVEGNKNRVLMKKLKPYAGINFSRIRPYKLVKGKKVFGRWAENEGD